MPESLIHVGTSGWHYKHWEGPFYPADVSQKEYLHYYARFFETAEINNSFYRLPTAEVFSSWEKAVPRGFTFAVKASRYITHQKKLNDVGRSVELLLERAKALGNKLGPVLFQLPPGWKLNLERLQEFLKVLPSGRQYAMELRDPSWFDETVIKALAEYNVAFCIYDMEGRLSPHSVTADFVYIRLHGPGGTAYTGRYSTAEMEHWAEFIREEAAKHMAVYCYFDNDEAGYAAANALELKKILQA